VVGHYVSTSCGEIYKVKVAKLSIHMLVEIREGKRWSVIS
jgi:hypothetical protein